MSADRRSHEITVPTSQTIPGQGIRPEVTDLTAAYSQSAAIDGEAAAEHVITDHEIRGRAGHLVRRGQPVGGCQVRHPFTPSPEGSEPPVIREDAAAVEGQHAERGAGCHLQVPEDLAALLRVHIQIRRVGMLLDEIPDGGPRRIRDVAEFFTTAGHHRSLTSFPPDRRGTVSAGHTPVP